MTSGDQVNPFEQQFEEAIEGIEAAGNMQPYSNELLRAAYRGASVLIDQNVSLKPIEQITYRKGIAELAGELATAHADETTAAEMTDRVKDCDKILKLLKPQGAEPDAEAPEAQAETPSEKPQEAEATAPAPRRRGRPKKADTSAGKTSGAKGK